MKNHRFGQKIYILLSFLVFCFFSLITPTSALAVICDVTDKRYSDDTKETVTEVERDQDFYAWCKELPGDPCENSQLRITVVCDTNESINNCMPPYTEINLGDVCNNIDKDETICWEDEKFSAPNDHANCEVLFFWDNINHGTTSCSTLNNMDINNPDYSKPLKVGEGCQVAPKPTPTPIKIDCVWKAPGGPDVFTEHPDGVDTALGCIPTHPGNFVLWILYYFVPFGGGIAFILLIANSINLMTSSGNPEKLAQAQSNITSIVVGLLIIIMAIYLLNLIGVQIIRIPDFLK